jgi:hypothetical protein
MQTQINDEDLLLEDEVADWLEVTTYALQRWRSRKNGGPAFIKIGSRIRYRRNDVRSWLEANRVVPVTAG